MALNPRIMAAVVLLAAWFAPSLASAHSGYTHPVPAARKGANAATEQVATSHAEATITIRTETTGATPAPVIDIFPGCASHCCGGMTCCTVALEPELSFAPTIAGSYAFLFARAGPLLGLPPKALPRPPKSFG